MKGPPVRMIAPLVLAVLLGQAPNAAIAGTAFKAGLFRAGSGETGEPGKAGALLLVCSARAEMSPNPRWSKRWGEEKQQQNQGGSGGWKRHVA